MFGLAIQARKVGRLRWAVGGALALAALSVVWTAGRGAAASLAAPATPVGKGITQAGKADKYSFVLFYRANEQSSEAMKTTLARAKNRLATKASVFTVEIGSKAEADLVTKYRAGQAPMPLTLVLAPNGAIVRVFTKPTDEDTLAGSFVTEATASLMGALQEQKVAVLCLQNSALPYQRESKRAAEAFAADKMLAGQAVVVVADPSREPDLLKRCGMKSAPKEATLVLLTPPGTALGTFAGAAATKEALMQKLQSASSSCSTGSSCGPSGCK